MQAYFDIHSHILPGVDDGAKDMEETLDMMSTAYSEGIRIMVATPHYVAGETCITKEKLQLIYEEVISAAENHGKELQIILGNELFYSQDLIEALKNGDALTIDGTRYILVEFLQSASFREIREGLNHCICAGYIPILAHVERYRCLIKEPNLVGHLINLGVYMQLNFSCIIKRITNPRNNFCRKLFKNEWVHFLGTDAHGAEDRAPLAREAATFLEKKYGEETMRQLLWENPMTMLEDRHL